MDAFSLRGVSKLYGSRRALDAVDLTLPRGCALGLLGPNGAGKTTILRLLLGFARATSGEVRLQGRPPQDHTSRAGLGYLPERLVLPGRTTIEAFLRLHGRLAGLDGAALDAEVDRVSELVGIADRRRDLLGGLSKGLMQRAGFAQAFLGRPPLLFFDEPTSGLDPIGMRQARGWIESAVEAGATVLISSHILSEVERICDRVAILHEGRVRADGTVGEIVGPNEQLEDAFMRLVGETGEAKEAG